MHQVILFFVDFMIHNSNLSFAVDWQNLAYEENEMAGEEKFFNLLDKCPGRQKRGGNRAEFPSITPAWAWALPDGSQANPSTCGER